MRGLSVRHSPHMPRRTCKGGSANLVDLQLPLYVGFPIAKVLQWINANLGIVVGRALGDDDDAGDSDAEQPCRSRSVTTEGMGQMMAHRHSSTAHGRTWRPPALHRSTDGVRGSPRHFCLHNHRDSMAQ